MGEGFVDLGIRWGGLWVSSGRDVGGDRDSWGQTGLQPAGKGQKGFLKINLLDVPQSK